mgnify:CR=1 FL=1
MEKKFLDLIVCPVSKEKLQYDKKNNELISKKAKLAYKVKNGIPIFFGAPVFPFFIIVKKTNTRIVIM